MPGRTNSRVPLTIELRIRILASYELVKPWPDARTKITHELPSITAIQSHRARPASDYAPSWQSSRSQVTS